VKICATHWAAMRQKVIDLGIDDRDDAADQQGAYDVNTASAMLHKEYQLDEESPRFRPTLAMASSIYSGALERYGPAIMMPNNAAEDGHHCPLCQDHNEFQRHVRGECDDPECQMGKVTTTSTPWDVEALDELAVSMVNYAREEGLLPRLQ
jgi:hypothetical protein